ncbi:MAG TPA: hypothetical protein VH440_01850 [Candidatus Limnocylindrales bacterium]|jgi:hypothetical protein
MSPHRPTRLGRALVAVLALLSLLVAACGTISRTPPVPTPADFPGIVSDMAVRGVQVGNIVSGDGGCNDANLSKTAIAFDASGIDQPTPVHIYVYIFRNRDTYERLRSSVDACARSYVTDPATYESVETSPYVLSGQGPWGEQFKDNLRAAIVEAAGTGD